MTDIQEVLDHLGAIPSLQKDPAIRATARSACDAAADLIKKLSGHDVGGSVLRGQYTNWKGDTRVRKIIPRRIRWGETEWHPDTTWLLEAWDLDKGELREFALKDFNFCHDE